MKFAQLAIPDVWKISLAPIEDERGFFARTYCADAFAAHGLPRQFEQSSLSRNVAKATLRGMHYQADPFAEAKFVRCVTGAIFDVAIDLRAGSPTIGQWVGEVLDSRSGDGLYIPPGFAHGFQTLSDDTDVLYQITPAFVAGHGAGVRWNDPAFAITWPLANPIMSDRDAAYPDWRP